MKKSEIKKRVDRAVAREALGPIGRSVVKDLGRGIVQQIKQEEKARALMKGMHRPKGACRLCGRTGAHFCTGKPLPKGTPTDYSWPPKKKRRAS